MVPTFLDVVCYLRLALQSSTQISEMHDQKYEHSQTSNLLAILKDNSLVRDILWEIQKSADTQVGPGSFSRKLNIIPGKTLYKKLSAALARLQMMINRFQDSEADKSLTQDSKKNIGIKQSSDTYRRPIKLLSDEWIE
ncbi:uncharacterized protein LOC128238498 [Mya arenaria]|uniref:uncharacterized protein LOC128238498 n=1 Tax=Mya arenaria TaxID=6604 RepID=UPI0022E65457|nr:uncharacterized protein LOC128238498 [Mya arenaria]